MVLACSLAVSCVLNPKTDDLPGSASLPDLDPITNPGDNVGGVGDGAEPGNTPQPFPDSPPNLGVDPSVAEPDAGGDPPNERLAADAGARLSDTFAGDASSDAE